MTEADTTAQSEGLDTAAQGDPVESLLSTSLIELRDLLVEALPTTAVHEHLGELTVEVAAESLPAVLTFARDDRRVSAEILSDVSAVHWPGGVVVENDQETTGWPTFTEVVEQGRIELNYILRSVAHNRWFRLRVTVPDETPRVTSATSHYSSANFMEREVFDMVGVQFDGHPNLTRILMPEDWEGHPHRKDYPLGGVEVMYKGTTVAPPDEREY